MAINLDLGKGSHTVEIVVLGQLIALTDHSENIKATLATQFQDFGIDTKESPRTVYWTPRVPRGSFKKGLEMPDDSLSPTWMKICHSLIGRLQLK